MEKGVGYPILETVGTATSVIPFAKENEHIHNCSGPYDFNVNMQHYL